MPLEPTNTEAFFLYHYNNLFASGTYNVFVSNYVMATAAACPVHILISEVTSRCQDMGISWFYLIDMFILWGVPVMQSGVSRPFTYCFSRKAIWSNSIEQTFYWIPHSITTIYIMWFPHLMWFLPHPMNIWSAVWVGGLWNVEVRFDVLDTWHLPSNNSAVFQVLLCSEHVRVALHHHACWDSKIKPVIQTHIGTRGVLITEQHRKYIITN